jgi:opacity protein-like surface antigen
MTVSRRIRRAALAGVAAAALLAGLPPLAQAQERPGWYGSLEGRYVMSDGDHTNQFNRFLVFQPLATSVAPGGDGGGGAAALGYRFASPWDVRFAFSDNQLGEATSGPSVLHFYSFLTDTNQSTASADYYLLDFDAGYHLALGRTDLRLSGGLRYAHFNENYRNTFSELYGPLSVALIDYRREKFSGLGPLIGARVHVPLGNSRFAVIGSGGGSMLFGDRTSQETSSFLGFTSVTNLRDDNRVYELEGALSLAYRISECWSAELGYRVEQWWNIVDTRSSLILLAGLNTGNHSNGNLLTHGPFVRVDFGF